jgi:sugar lactone lactonase YvrE
MKRAAAALAASALCVALAATMVVAGQRPPGDTRVLAPIPAPGFPEAVVLRGNRVFVSTASRSGNAGTGPSVVFAFDAHSGVLRRSYVIQGETLTADHLLTGMALDRGRGLYALSSQLGVVRLDLKTGLQTLYADPIPDLPRCALVPAGTPCSPTSTDQVPLPNDIAFDPAGNAYVTDSAQATIFRIPPGGGTPQIWFQDAQLDGVAGPNGVRVSPDRTRLFFAVTFDSTAKGHIDSLPLVDQPTAADLTVFHTYNTEAPDDIAFAKSGNLYATLALSNQVSVLDPSGNEVTRFSGPASNGTPYDSPSGIAFAGATRSLLVANHALFTQNAQHMVLFDVYAGERGDPLVRPVPR